MIEAYIRLHQVGTAHSIEVWEEDRLAGGLYGLSIGRVFFGESMFSARRDASKVAIVHLCRQLQQWDFAMLDCQVSNPHLERLGAVQIPRESFLRILKENIDRPAPPEEFAGAFSPPGGDRPGD